jgi:hypothetical protein
VRYGLEPELTIYVTFEGGVEARILAESAEDEERMLLDLEARENLADDVVLALDLLLLAYRERRAGGT